MACDGALVPRADAKSRLQELCQASGVRPEYRVVSRAGSVHDPVFEVEVVAGDIAAARGTGRSLKDAEQDAASRALEDLERL
jgi:ribonuclease-3